MSVLCAENLATENTTSVGIPGPRPLVAAFSCYGNFEILQLLLQLSVHSRTLTACPSRMGANALRAAHLIQNTHTLPSRFRLMRSDYQFFLGTS